MPCIDNGKFAFYCKVPSPFFCEMLATKDGVAALAEYSQYLSFSFAPRLNACPEMRFRSTLHRIHAREQNLSYSRWRTDAGGGRKTHSSFSRCNSPPSSIDAATFDFETLCPSCCSCCCFSCVCCCCTLSHLLQAAMPGKG